IHVNPSKIKAVKNWEAPRTPSKKSKTFDWGEEQEKAFQTLKDKLCNAPVLALPDGPKEFVVYCDASGLGLGYVLTQRGKVIAYASRQLKIYENNYTTNDLELDAVVFVPKIWGHYIYGKKRIIYTDHKSLQHIFNRKELNMRQRRWIELFYDYDCEIRYHPGKANVVADALSRKERIKPKRVRAINMTLQSSIKDRILAAQKEASNELTEMQRGMDELMKRRSDGALCLTCLKVKTEHQRLPGLLQQPKIPEWKCEGIAMDFVTKLPRTSSEHDTIWVISMQEALGTRLDMSMAYHPQTNGQSERTIQTWEDMLRACAEVGEGHLIGPELVQETTEKISQIKDRLKAACVVRFGKKGKLAPRFVRPFEIIEKVGLVANRLRLPEELNGVHDTFHVSNLKKCLADLTLQVPLDEIQVDVKLNFVEEPMEILERDFKKLKRCRIAIVKVRWSSRSLTRTCICLVQSVVEFQGQNSF
ncbi:putative reverse transcriptase domain-containing protein, partial [Tanacetum coccineum]